MRSHQPHHRHAVGRSVLEARDLYMQVFDEAPRGMVLLALDGRVLRANRAAGEVLGRTIEELRSTFFDTVVSPDDVDVDCLLAQRLLRGEIQRYQTEKRCRRRDGATIHARLAFSLVRDRDGLPQYRIVEIEDVSERIACEEALRASEARLRDLVELAPDGIFVADLQGHYTWVNGAATTITGYSREELLGMSIVDLIPSERGRLSFLDETRLPHSRPFRSEWTWTRRGGEQMPVEVSSKILPDGRWQAFVRDITERKRAEHERENALKWLWTVVEQCPVGITLVMDKAGTKTMTNLRGQRLFGRSFSSDTQTAEYATYVRTPDGQPMSVLDMPSHRAMRGETVPPVELLLCRPDGRQIPSLINAAALVDAQGEVQGAVVVFEDITPQKELERLRTEWSSIVAHDLRQPLNAIAVHAQLIAMGAPALEAPLKRISQAVTRLNRMVQDLLDLSQLEARRMVLVQESVDLAALVARSVELVAPQAPDRRFEVRVYGDAPFVALDPDRIAQVVENLLSNAVKYGASESPILVEIDTTGPQVSVSVTNEGAGIDPADLPHLFNRFYRVEGGARVKGVGLGLYIARELVEAHGGRIAADSLPGGTTWFRFTLPRAAPIGAY
jgi:PAS domain S-box-containing protein